MLTTLVKKDFIAVNVEAENWVEAIVCAGKLMRQGGCIEERYIDRMVETTRVMGPYIVIAPGVALAHARPGEGVLRVCVSIATLKRPVVFGNPEHDPVRLVIGVAAPDDQSHMEVITDIARLLSAVRQPDCICNCKTSAEIIQLLRSAVFRCSEPAFTPA